jgi:predicted O-linked N-acetylglucosamine transferase (SPINDLY family)
MHSLEALIASARQLTLEGRVSEAAEECERALALGPAEPAVHSLLGQVLGDLAEELARRGQHAAAAAQLDRAVGLDSSSARLHFLRANALLATNQFEAAASGYRWVLARHPRVAEVHNNLGATLLRSGRVAEAADAFAAATALRPDYAEAHANLGEVRMRLGDPAGSVESLMAAVAARPESVANLRRLGNALLTAGRGSEAEEVLRRAVARGPSDPDAHHDLGAALLTLGRPIEAAGSFEKALQIDPAFAEAAVNLGEALRCQGRAPESLAFYRRALEINPGLAAAAAGLGVALLECGDTGEAVRSLARATHLDPGFVDAHIAHARALEQAGAGSEAIASLQSVLLRSPQQAAVHFALGALFHRGGRPQDAIGSYEVALAVNPALMEAHCARGQALESLLRYSEAAQSYQHARTLRADDVDASAGLLSCAVRTCNWAAADRELQSLRRIPGGIEAISPLLLLAVSEDLSEIQRASAARARRTNTLVPARGEPFHPGPRIRVAYMSSDFRVHPTSYLIAELIEQHDRRNFEVYCLSIGPDDDSAVRARIARSCDHFVDMQGLSDRAAADWIRERRIDIAVDLNGYIERARTGILAHRPAPLQVSYLGFPGTMAADHIDYLLADEVVLPEAHQPFYRESIAYLPDCYQVNDRRRPLPAPTASAMENGLRGSYGLPEAGIVFCCFNNSWKITAPVFDGWLQILERVEGSVLWLLDDNPWATHNLRERAAARGIAPQRLIFAPRTSQADHLARHIAADLFLDTLPYNAHTTGSDALWCGVPVITCPGNSFSARVAASLLRAVGLPQLITSSAAEYLELSVALAHDAGRLKHLREHLIANRSRCALFDTTRFCRNLEAAYRQMIETQHRGVSPQTFRVAATGAG